MRRSSRLAIWCLALLLSLSLCSKGRAPAGKGEGAALLRAGAGSVKVRLAGECPRPGVYLFPDGATVGTAIKMTLPELGLSAAARGKAGERLRSGDVLTVTHNERGGAELSVAEMGVKERMLLRIPLDPDRLQAADWSELPGVGPVLSARIVAERQKNGAFLSLEGLARVPGMGPAKLAALRPYF